MEKVELSVLQTLQLQPDLLDDINYLSSVIGVGCDVLINDAIKMYLSAMRICTHRFIGNSDDLNVVDHG